MHIMYSRGQFTNVEYVVVYNVLCGSGGAFQSKLTLMMSLSQFGFRNYKVGCIMGNVRFRLFN